MAVPAHEKIWTVEDFWAQYAGKPYELVRGKVVEVSPSGGEASSIAASILIEIGIYLREHPIGFVTGADGGYYLSPGTLRAPDVGFYSSDKAAQITEPDKYLPFPPDLAVEVVSPNDSATDVQEKVKLYLESGTALVWVVYPAHREVVIHHADRSARTYAPGETLDGEGVLPGLQIAVASLFPQQDVKTTGSAQ